jgi:hypothetical protein
MGEEGAQPIWHLLRDGKQYGPISGDRLLQLAALRKLRPDDLLWRIRGCVDPPKKRQFFPPDAQAIAVLKRRNERGFCAFSSIETRAPQSSLSSATNRSDHATIYISG